MDPSGYVDVLRNTFSTVALLVSAAIIPSLIVGLCVAVFQATTSINEQTLSFLPRLLITIVAIALGVNWGLQQVMDFLGSAIMQYMVSVIWPFLRISSMIGAMFILGSRMLPIRIRLVFCIVITWAVIPLIPPVESGIELFSLEGAIVTINQIIIGTTLGFVTEFIAQCFILAGQVVAMQTGLGFASIMDPVNGASTPVVGQFFSMLCALVFFGIDGHLVFIDLIHKSFTTLPVGLNFIAPSSWETLSLFLSVMFQVAVNFSIASICTMLIINFALGVMTRAAPQLNIFSMGFAVSMILGIGVLWLTLGGFMGYFEKLFDHVTEMMCTVMNYQCTGSVR